MTQKEKLAEFYKWLKETTVSRRQSWFKSEDEMRYVLQADYSAFDEVLTKFTSMGLTHAEDLKLQLGLKYECLETSYYSDSKDEMFTKGRIYVVTQQYGYLIGLPSNDGNVRTLDCGVLTTEYFKLIE